MKNDIKYWWTFLLTGLLLLIAGFVILLYPVSSYISIAFFVSLLLIVLGIGYISFAVANKKFLPYWGWHLFIGVLDVIWGIILFVYPHITMTVLPFMVGFLFLLRAVSLISYAFTLRRVTGSGWGWLLAGGILTLLFAFFIIYYPFFGVFTVIIWTASAFMIAGIFNMVLAFRLKREKADIQPVIV
jgi:uncharacterized membrane protein HdeD (DUF308 family)